MWNPCLATALSAIWQWIVGSRCVDLGGLATCLRFQARYLLASLLCLNLLLMLIFYVHTVLLLTQHRGEV